MPSKIRRWFDSLVCRQRQFVCEIARLLNKRTKKKELSHTNTQIWSHCTLHALQRPDWFRWLDPPDARIVNRTTQTHTKRRRRETHHYQAEAATSTKRIGMQLVVVEKSAVERGIPIVSNISHPVNFSNSFKLPLLKSTHNRRDRD